MPTITSYRRPFPGTQPDYLFPPYASTVKRAPTKPLVRLPQTQTELMGPVFGYDEVKRGDHDLTQQHAGDPIGERIVVGGRVLDENGRPVPHTLVEIWQANAAGRYPHRVDQHDAAPVAGGLLISQQPDVGEDAGVVKELVGEHDDGVKPVVF